MKRQTIAWLAAGFVLPAVVLGVPYLSADYSSLEATGVVYGWGLGVLFGTALLVQLLGRPPLPLAAAMPLLAMLTIVVLRIFMDTAADPTNHNLWPFEIAIVLIIGGGASILGALLGAWVARIAYPKES